MKKSYLVLHFAVILAGFTGIFGKLISLNEGLLVWYRLFFPSIIIFLVLKLFKVRDCITSKKKFDIAKIGLFITIHWVFFYESIKYSNISIGVVCYCLTSFFTAVFSPLINRQRLHLREFRWVSYWVSYPLLSLPSTPFITSVLSENTIAGSSITTR